MNIEKITNTQAGLSGEYFVAAELYRRNWSVGITLGNTKAIDMFAEKNDKAIAIQVKTIQRKQSSSWMISAENVKKNCFYVLVNLNIDTMQMPDCYIFTPEEVISMVKQYKEIGNVELTKVKSTKSLNAWEKLEK